MTTSQHLTQIWAALQLCLWKLFFFFFWKQICLFAVVMPILSKAMDLTLGFWSVNAKTLVNKPISMSSNSSLSLLEHALPRLKIYALCLFEST